MDNNSIRLIPQIFDKLFYKIAPADALVCGNAYFMFGPVACRQVRDRLAMPKRRMLLLTWPLCMHSGENTSNFYKQVEFYDVLRTNVRKNGGGCRNIDAVTDAKLTKFLVGFESFMLRCVLSSAAKFLYTNLNVLMLDFHAHDLYDLNIHSAQKDLFDAEPRKKWFLSKFSGPATSNGHVPYHETLCMNTELWGEVINAVVAQCAPTLRHFVFISSFWLSDYFYADLKLDCMLARMRELETLYMPSIDEYQQAHLRLSIRRPCWQALHDSPIETRLPSLRRIVVHSPKSANALIADLAAVLAAFGSNNNVTEVATKGLLPQFRCLPPKLAVEVIDNSNATQNLRLSPSVCSNIDCFVRGEKKRARSIRARNFFKDDLTSDQCRENIPQFVSGVEKSVLEIDKYRTIMRSVIVDVVTTNNSQQNLVCKLSDGMKEIASKHTTLVMNTLSCCLSRPLSLTVQFYWYDLVRHLALFTTMTPSKRKKYANGASHWSSCFPRGILKLRLKVKSGLQFSVATHGPNPFKYPKERRERAIALFLKKCRKSYLSVYRFPPSLSVEFCPPALRLKYGEEDGNIPSIQNYFRRRVQKFVDDITGEIPITIDAENFIDFSTGELATLHEKTIDLRTDLYASCRKLVIIFKVCCEFPPRFRTSNSEPYQHRMKHAILQQVEKLLFDKQFEQELVQLFCIPGTAVHSEAPQLIMPNLKSISIVRNVEVVD